MTSYINSIQQISITLTSATSNTATVSSPTGTYFILWQGQTTSGTANQAVSQARIEITNSTTITAFLNTSGTVTVNAVLIDATSSLITSVQSGTVTWGTGATSGTATITSVTNANTAIAWLGYTTTETGFGLSNNDTIVSLSGTTVTVSKQFAGFTETTGFCVIEFAGAALNSSVQNVAATTPGPSSATWTKTITSVNRSNSFMVWGGSYGNSTANSATVQPNAQLTAATTITFTTGASSFVSQQVNLCVVEFATGVLNSAVQRATVATSSSTSNTGTITSVSTSNAFVNFLSNNTNDTAGSDAKDHGKITLTNATTVTFTINTAATDVASFEVVEFAAGSTNWALALSSTAAGSVTATLACDKQLLYSQTADGSISANLYRQRLMAFAATAAGSISATLACDKQLLLTAQAAGSLAATLAIDARLLLAATGAGSIAATLNYNATLASTLSAVGSLSAALTRDLALNLSAGGAGSLAATLAVDARPTFSATSSGGVSGTIQKDAGGAFNSAAEASFTAALTSPVSGACSLISDSAGSCSMGIDRGLSLSQAVFTVINAELTVEQGNPIKYGWLGDSNLMDERGA